jgi:hypothetical protein
MYSRVLKEASRTHPTTSVVSYWTKSMSVVAVLADFVQLVLRNSFIVCFTFRIHSSILLT